jgi:hypothetical protein
MILGPSSPTVLPIGEEEKLEVSSGGGTKCGIEAESRQNLYLVSGALGSNNKLAKVSIGLGFVKAPSSQLLESSNGSSHAGSESVVRNASIDKTGITLDQWHVMDVMCVLCEFTAVEASIEKKGVILGLTTCDKPIWWALNKTAFGSSIDQSCSSHSLLQDVIVYQHCRHTGSQSYGV